MFVVMIVAIGGSESLTREKQQGTLARLAVTTISQGEIIAGKLLHLGLVGFVQACVLLAAGEAIGRFHLFNIDFSWGPNWWVVVLFTLPYAFTVAGLTLLMGGLFRTTQQAESLAWLVGMVFSAMGGCWWPAEIMPRGAQIAAHLFPTYWSMQAPARRGDLRPRPGCHRPADRRAAGHGLAAGLARRPDHARGPLTRPPSSVPI